VATEPTTPQALFRVGGVNTVRGFEYARLRGPAFWAGQLDMTPFNGRVRPVAFIDVGQASRMSRLFSSTAMVGAGVGLSLFRGLLRFDLSHPVSPDHGSNVRFDLLVQSAM
jgi:outer membrane translocation and assembly module TamA